MELVFAIDLVTLAAPAGCILQIRLLLPFTPNYSKRCVRQSKSTTKDLIFPFCVMFKALSILDCLTSPKDDTDPDYNLEKDIRRDDLLLMNDYGALKV